MIFGSNIGNDTLSATGYGIANSFISTQNILDTTTNSMSVVVTVDSIGFPTPSSYGVCYGTSSVPTVNGSVIDNGPVSSTLRDTITISGLEMSTNYYVRAFITVDGITQYGNILSVKTYGAPKIATIAPSNIKDTSAMEVISIKNLGNPGLSQYGICWNTTGMPDLSDNHTEEEAVTAISRYGSLMANLSAFTTYFVRAYAINDIDTVYGEQVVFTSDKGMPEIEWENPSNIAYGTLLSNVQLNASAYYNGSPIEGTYTYTPDTDSVLNAGSNTLSVTFTPSDAVHFYATTKAVNITVDKALLTVSANDTSRTYGDGDPNFRLTYSGLVNGEDISVIDILPVGSTTTTFISDIGSYSIVISGGADDNYTFAYASALMEITKRNLTLSNFTANAKVYDGTTNVTAGFSDDRVVGDELTFSFDAAFESRTAGDAKTVNYSNIAISGGADAENYTLVSTVGETSAAITAKSLSVGGTFTVYDKEYDATVEATINSNNLTLLGVIPGDIVELSPVSEFTSAAVGQNIVVQLTSASTLSGADAANYSLSLDGAPSTTANITEPIIYYTLSLLINPEEAGTATGDGSYLSGTEVSLSVAGNEGYTFKNWTNGGVVVSETANFAYTMPASNTILTANFELKTFVLTYMAGEHGSISGTSPQLVNYGADGAAVEAVPDEGYHFENWSDGSTNNPRTDRNVKDNINVTANFGINTYTVTFTVLGNGNPIAGATITVNTQTLTTDGNGMVSAELANGSYDYTVSADSYQSVSESVTVNGVNTSVTVTLTPDGIGSSSLSSILVYPNPFYNNLTIEKGGEVPVYYTLTNIAGSTLASGLLNGTKSVLNLSYLNKGVYILQIYSSKGSKTIRVVKN